MDIRQLTLSRKQALWLHVLGFNISKRVWEHSWWIWGTPAISVLWSMCVPAWICPALRGPMDYIPLVSPVHGIIQARMLEWVTVSSSRGSSWPRDWTCVSYVSCIDRLSLHHLGSPQFLSYAFSSPAQILWGFFQYNYQSLLFPLQPVFPL